ncbi:adhesion G protein-coupled receptor L3-like [Glandiceps talaboti]
MAGSVNTGGTATALVATYPSNQAESNQACAVILDNSFVDFNYPTNECLGDVALCTSGFSLSVWLRLNIAQNPTTERYIYNTGGHTTSGRGFSVSFEPVPSPRIVFEAMAPDTPGNLKHLVYKSSFPDDTWFHAIFVYDQPTKTGIIYINGMPSVLEQQETSEPESPHSATGFYVGTPNDDIADATKKATVAISDLVMYYQSFTAQDARDYHLCQNPAAVFTTTTTPPTTTAQPTSPAAPTIDQLIQLGVDSKNNEETLHISILHELIAIMSGHTQIYTVEEMEAITVALTVTVPSAAKEVTVATEFIEICSNVLDILNEETDDRPQKVTFVTGKFMYLLETFAERFATAHDCDDGPLVLDTTNIGFKVACSHPGGTASEKISFENVDDGYSVSILIPVEEIQVPVTVAIIVYGNVHEHISNKALGAKASCPDGCYDANAALDQREVNITSHITSFVASSDLGVIKDFSQQPVYIDMKMDNTLYDGTAFCGFWKFYHSGEGGIWSNDGCSVVEVDADNTNLACKCNHLTNFAVLMQVSGNEIQLSSGHSIALENLTYICSVSSIFCLVLTLGCYTYLRLWKSQRIILHANLAVSLVIAQTTYLVGIEAKPEEICTVVAVMLHYFFTASFSWMLIEGANLYIKSIFVFAKDVPTAGLVAAGWGIPAIVVGISLGIRFEGYGRDGICWLSFEDGLIWAFAGPVIFVIAVNAIILIMVLRVFMTLKANADKTDIERLRVGIRAIVMLQPLLGLTWLFGAFAINEETVIFQYLFIICNALQGLFIFILHCAMNEEVKQAFLKRRRIKASHTGATASLSMRDTSSTMNTKSTSQF